MSKQKRRKQTAIHMLPSRGARFFLSEIEAGRVTLAQLIESKQMIETQPRSTNLLMADAVSHYYADACEAIAILEQQQLAPHIEQPNP